MTSTPTTQDQNQTGTGESEKVSRASSAERCLQAARRIANFYEHEHGVKVDEFDVERVAASISGLTGIRQLEFTIMNVRADLQRVIESLQPEDRDGSLNP